MRSLSRSVRALSVVGAVATTAVVAASGAVALVAPTPLVAAKAKVTTVSRTAHDVRGSCSSPSGFVTNGSGTVKTLKVTVSPSSPRAGSKMTVKVFVKQTQRTLAGSSYPKAILQGQVVVKFGSKSHLLRGPSNANAFTGVIFPKGFTAKGTFKAPAKGKHKLTVSRIVYNARGGFNGGWSTPYVGFDLVCSGGQNPLTHVTAYSKPRLTLTVRKHA